MRCYTCGTEKAWQGEASYLVVSDTFECRACEAGRLAAIRLAAKKPEERTDPLTLERLNRIADLERTLEHSNYWNATRWQRLSEWARTRLERPYREEFFSILANGTATLHEPPTYAQQMNMLKHRAESAELRVAELEAALRGCVDVLTDSIEFAKQDADSGYAEALQDMLNNGTGVINDNLDWALQHLKPARDAGRAALERK